MRKIFVSTVILIFASLSCGKKTSHSRSSDANSPHSGAPDIAQTDADVHGEDEADLGLTGKKLGDRNFVASFFEVIFANKTNETNDDKVIRAKIRSLITRQSAVFGGPCTRYDHDCSRGEHANGSEASAVPDRNTLRVGYVNRACQEILAIDHAVNQALQKVALISASPTNHKNIGAVFDLFYPGLQPPTPVLDSLAQVAQSAEKKSYPMIDRWRFVLLAICESGAWDSI